MKLVGYLFRSLYRSIRGRLTFPRKIKLNWLNTAIPWEKLVNTEIPCQKSTKYRYRIYFRYWLATNVPPSMALLSNFVTFLQVRWPLHALTRNVRWNVCNEIQAAHIQSTWRLAEAEFIIINRKNIKLFHFTISGDRKIVLFFISRICLDPAAVRKNERCHATTFPRFNSP